MSHLIIIPSSTPALPSTVNASAAASTVTPSPCGSLGPTPCQRGGPHWGSLHSRWQTPAIATACRGLGTHFLAGTLFPLLSCCARLQRVGESEEKEEEEEGEEKEEKEEEGKSG